VLAQKFITAELVIGVLAAATICATRAGGCAASCAVRAQEVAKAAVDLVLQPVNPARASPRLCRTLVRLNEAALMVGARLHHQSPHWHPGALLQGGIHDVENRPANHADPLRKPS
jgi:hypothetical protein